MDWGLSKDLFIPFAEQHHPLKPGNFTIVKVYLDNQGRPAGSTRIDHWIEDTATGLKVGEKVSLLVAEQTELGFKAIINHQFWGLLYSNELYRRIRRGQALDGYIQRIRDDGKIDLSLNQPGFNNSKIDERCAKNSFSVKRKFGIFSPHRQEPSPCYLRGLWCQQKSV